MMEKMINLLDNNFVVPKALINKYKELNISDSELIVLIYLINNKNSNFNPKVIGEELNQEINSIMTIISNLIEKDLIKIETKLENSKKSEYISLENLYNKLAFIVINNNEEKMTNTNLFDTFEKEFGRTISPMEYEIINGWLDSGHSEEFILLGLKAATYNGVTSLRYIDKVLSEWTKKGIKSKEDIEKERRSFNNKKSSNKELFDYDWLNEKEANN